jgi:hypothetical protein
VARTRGGAVGGGGGGGDAKLRHVPYGAGVGGSLQACERYLRAAFRWVGAWIGQGTGAAWER